MSSGYFTFDPALFPGSGGDQGQGELPGSSFLSNSAAVVGPAWQDMQRSAKTFWADNAGSPDEREARNAVNRFRNSFASAWGKYSQQTLDDAQFGYSDYSDAIDRGRDKVLASVSDGARDILRPVLDSLHHEGMQIGLAHWERQNQAVNRKYVQLAQLNRDTMADVSDPNSGASTQNDGDRKGVDQPNIVNSEQGTIDNGGLDKPFDMQFDQPSLGELPSYFAPGSEYPFNSKATANAVTANSSSIAGDKYGDKNSVMLNNLPLVPSLAAQLLQNEWAQRNRQAVVDHLNTKLLDHPILFPTPGLVPGTIQMNYREPELRDLYGFGADVLSVGLPVAGTLFRSASGALKLGGFAARTTEVAPLAELAGRLQPATKPLFHYTTEEGLAGILASRELRPSLQAVNRINARYGNGQYVTNIAPGTLSPQELADALVRNPYKWPRFTHFIEINPFGINVIKGREGVFLIPNQSPLDLTGRIIRYGAQ